MNMSEPIPKEVVEQVSHPVIKLLQSKAGLWVVGLISFIEGALLVPIITDPFMVAYILANRTKTFLAVAVTTVTSVAGGVAAYFMGFYFSELVLSYLSPDNLNYFSSLAEQARAETLALTIIGAITPVPYTLVGLAIGFVKGNIWVFIVASIFGRGLRYVVVGYLTYKFGAKAMKHIKRNLTWATVATVILVAVYVVYKLL